MPLLVILLSLLLLLFNQWASENLNNNKSERIGHAMVKSICTTSDCDKTELECDGKTKSDCDNLVISID